MPAHIWNLLRRRGLHKDLGGSSGDTYAVSERRRIEERVDPKEENWARDQSNVGRLVGSCALLVPNVQS